METPRQLNGFPVIRVEQHKVCSTVMVDTGNDHGLVVATWAPAHGTAWIWGHYFPLRATASVEETRRTHQEALDAFNATALRNAKRL